MGVVRLCDSAETIRLTKVPLDSSYHLEGSEHERTTAGGETAGRDVPHPNEPNYHVGHLEPHVSAWINSMLYKAYDGNVIDLRPRVSGCVDSSRRRSTHRNIIDISQVLPQELILDTFDLEYAPIHSQVLRLAVSTSLLK